MRLHNKNSTAYNNFYHISPYPDSKSNPSQQSVFDPYKASNECAHREWDGHKKTKVGSAIYLHE